MRNRKPSIILTNPPFGSGHDLRIKETNILAQYKNGFQWDVSDDGEIIYTDKLNDRQGLHQSFYFLKNVSAG